MRPISNRSANAIVLAMALGLGALYGGATALVLQVLDCREAVEIGGLVSCTTGGLGLIVALFAIIYFAPSRPFENPMNRFGLLFIGLACLSFFILIAPLIILTGGRARRWLFGGPTCKEDE